MSESAASECYAPAEVPERFAVAAVHSSLPFFLSHFIPVPTARLFARGPANRIR
jgi:hypothetical protein